MRQAQFKSKAQTKLAGIVRLEKYKHECPALKKYWEKYVTAPQLKTPNLDDHSAYLVFLLRNQ